MNRYKAIAEYYDFEYARKRMLDLDVPFFLKHLPMRKPQDVLEIAAGTGRAAIPIAQAGHRVVGVDYAQDMLDIAGRKRDAVGLTDRQCRLVRQDALKLNLRQQRFDWACIFFNTFLSFVTLDEQDRALRGIHRHLRPRGRLWIDIFNPNMEILGHQRMRDVDPSLFYVPRFERNVMQTVDIERKNATNQIQLVTFRYRWFDANGREHAERVKFEMTYMHARELRILLERNGFVIEKLYGDYDGSALAARSERIIALARRS